MAGDDNPLYEIEAIVKHRRIGNGYEYLVKWKNYASDQNTWIPPENFQVDFMLKAYNQKHNIMTHDMEVDDGNAASNPTIDDIINNPLPSSDIFNDLLPNEDYTPNIKVEKLLDVQLPPSGDDQNNKIALVKWESKPLPEYVPAEWAFIHYPELAIEFFESRTFFISRNDRLERFQPNKA